MNKKQITFVIALSCIIFIITQTKYVLSDPSLNVSNLTAGGGNVTPLNLNGTSESTIWQGFFGEVNGGIILEDAAGTSMYDWNLVGASGEVLAARTLISDWSSINCTNQTEIYKEEARLNISNSSTDGINDTYLNTTHPSFEVAGRIMTGCRSTLTDNSTDQKVVFWNVLLNTNTVTTIYTAIIDDGVIGFNGTATDFQLLVPVNTTTSQSLYNIYVELD